MKFYHSLAFATALLAVGCTGNENVIEPETPIDNSLKEVIAFSMSDGDAAAATRAAAPTQEAFSSPTRMVMHIRSNKSNGTTNVLYNKTIAETKTCTEGGTDHSDITFEGANKRYWDDAFGRDAYLSVYAVAIPNITTASVLNASNLTGGDPANTWTTCTDTDAIEMTWSVTKNTQTETTWNNEDLTYSNNIQKTGKDGRTYYDYTADAWHPSTHKGGDGNHGNGCLQFVLKSSADPTGPGTFDKGHLKFNHALTRIEVELIEGTGFDGNKTTTTDFNFTNTKAAAGSNIKLLGMYTSGKLNMKNGTWTKDTATPINAMWGSTTAANNKFKAQMLPDYVFNESANTTNVMEFEIDNNMYYVTQSELYTALASVAANQDADYGYDGTAKTYTMKPGKFYHFKITVNKKQIEAITATVAKWIDVTAANENIDNTHVKFNMLEADGTICDDLKFYRLKEDLGKIYTDNTYYTTDGLGITYSGDYMTEGAATLSDPDSDKKNYITNWYYDDNQTAYHFRTINTLANGTIANTTGTPAKTYFTMSADATTKDYHWGAPMKTGATLAYSTTEGYKNNLHPGITSTESDINITELHMMSNLNIVLKTPDADNKVNLTGATVTLTLLSTGATVDMGTGLITPGAVSATQATTAPTTYWKTTNLETNPFTCSVIPQTLVRGDADADYVGITITTSDNNQYYVVKRLSEIIGTTTTSQNQTSGQAIKYWYPNHNYTYTFTITKKGIENITCTVAKWVDVTADNVNLDLGK